MERWRRAAAAVSPCRRVTSTRCRSCRSRRYALKLIASHALATLRLEGPWFGAQQSCLPASLPGPQLEVRSATRVGVLAIDGAGLLSATFHSFWPKTAQRFMPISFVRIRSRTTCVRRNGQPCSRSVDRTATSHLTGTGPVRRIRFRHGTMWPCTSGARSGAARMKRSTPTWTRGRPASRTSFDPSLRGCHRRCRQTSLAS